MVTIEVEKEYADFVLKIWRKHGYKPFRIERWKGLSRVRIELKETNRLFVTPDGILSEGKF